MDDVESSGRVNVPRLGPDRSAVIAWLRDQVDRAAQGELDQPELLNLLEQARSEQFRAHTVISSVTDTLLLLAHDHGASLPALAERYNRTGGRRYVNAPRSRLASVRQYYPTAHALVEALEQGREVEVRPGPRTRSSEE